MKKILLNILRWAIPLGILAYLFHRLRHAENAAVWRIDPADWYLPALALVLITAATLICVVRWWLLVRALRFTFHLADALQLGFLAELLNFAAIGVVGGDVFKAFFIARNQPGRRAQAVWTVLVDRVVGLGSLSLLASIAILSTGFWRTASPEVQAACFLTLVLTLLGACALITITAMRPLEGRLAARVKSLPLVGATLSQIIDAIGQYRRRWRVLLAAVGLSLTVHSLLAASVYVIGLATTRSPPSLGSHLIMTPLATMTGILPLPWEGLGAFEWVLDTLYQQASRVAQGAVGQGLVVALGYRLLSLIMAVMGALAFLIARRNAGVLIRGLAAARK